MIICSSVLRLYYNVTKYYKIRLYLKLTHK
nr:MAG TPA: hypothetical protein [Bacteriophage sp.]